MSFRSFLGSMFRSRATLTFCLVVALLWAPIWGQWHGIAHPVQQTAVAPSGDTAADQDEGHALGSALCQVLDHLGHASALSAWPVLPVLLSFLAAAPVSVARPDPLARAGWTPQARAPPSWI